MASDEEVGAVNPRIAVEAEKGRVGGAVESGLLVAELATPILHFRECSRTHARTLTVSGEKFWFLWTDIWKKMFEGERGFNGEKSGGVEE